MPLPNVIFARRCFFSGLWTHFRLAGRFSIANRGGPAATDVSRHITAVHWLCAKNSGRRRARKMASTCRSCDRGPAWPVENVVLTTLAFIRFFVPPLSGRTRNPAPENLRVPTARIGRVNLIFSTDNSLGPASPSVRKRKMPKCPTNQWRGGFLVKARILVKYREMAYI